MGRRLFSLLLWSAVAVWGGTILGFSSVPGQDLPEAAFLFSDKFNHFAAFVAGGWLTASAFRLTYPEPRATRFLVLTVVLLAAFGAFDEALQTFTPGRQGGDLYDWIADFLGAIAGALLTLLTHARLERFVTRR